jgi:hypothetical protein
VPGKPKKKLNKHLTCRISLFFLFRSPLSASSPRQLLTRSLSLPMPGPAPKSSLPSQFQSKHPTEPISGALERANASGAESERNPARMGISSMLAPASISISVDRQRLAPFVLRRSGQRRLAQLPLWLRSSGLASGHRPLPFRHVPRPYRQATSSEE